MIAGALWITSGYPQSDAFLRDSRYPADPSGGGVFINRMKCLKKRLLSIAYATMHDFRICTIAGFSGGFLRDSRYPAGSSGGGGLSAMRKAQKKRLLSTAYAPMYDFRICVIAGFSGLFCVTIRTYCGLQSAFRTTSCVPCLLSATSPSASASCARRTSHGRMFSFCPERCGSLARRRFPPLA